MQQRGKYNYPAWLLFIVAMGVWSLAITGHELLGHGGVCAIDTGCDWRYADAMYFDGSRQSGLMLHLLRAGGSLFNLLSATAAALLLWNKAGLNHYIRLVLWLILTINLFQSGSYIGFGWLIHPGMDWAKLSLLLPQPLGHILVTLLGGIIVTAGFILSRYFYPAGAFLKTKIKMFGIPLLACAFVAITASMLIPTDDRLMMVQGGIGGSIGFLFWMIILAFLPMPHNKLSEIRSDNGPSHNVSNLLTRAIILTLSIFMTFFYLGVLAPGINYS